MNDIPRMNLAGQLEEARPPAFTDEALALRFAERHAKDLRFVAAMGKWLRWDGSRWAFDDTLFAFDRSRRICREASAECNKPRTSSVLASAKTVAAVERLAKADRRLAATADQWDADPWLLNTPLGVIDLRTGELRPQEPADYMTKLTAVAPDPGCSIGTWLAVLARVAGGDARVSRLSSAAIRVRANGIHARALSAFRAWNWSKRQDHNPQRHHRDYVRLP